jgi:hypothetical protein
VRVCVRQMAAFQDGAQGGVEASCMVQNVWDGSGDGGGTWGTHLAGGGATPCGRGACAASSAGMCGHRHSASSSASGVASVAGTDRKARKGSQEPAGGAGSAQHTCREDAAGIRDS